MQRCGIDGTRPECDVAAPVPVPTVARTCDDGWAAAGTRQGQSRPLGHGCAELGRRWRAQLAAPSRHGACGECPLPGLLPDDMTGLDAIELGCGTAYVSAWMARRGATVVGIDNSERQLATARRLAAEHGVDADARARRRRDRARTPTARSTSPSPSTARRSGATRTCGSPKRTGCCGPAAPSCSSAASTLASLCSPSDGSLPITDRLERDYFTMHRLDWREAADEPGGIEFNLPMSGWFRLFRDTGFDVVDFLEIQAPEPARTRRRRCASSSPLRGRTVTRASRCGCCASADRR